MLRTFGCACLVLCLVATSFAAKPSSRAASKKASAEEMDFFAAEKAGDIEVRVIAKDSSGGNVLIKNKTKKPLSIKLPEAFVGVPVAAQFGGGMMGGMGGMGGGMGGMGMGGMGGMVGGMQAMGGGMMGGMGGGMGGMGGMGGGMGGMGGGGGFFRVEPEKVGKIKIVTVCLEHGKKDPSPHVQYKLMPAESYTKNTSTIETLKMVARGEVDQRSAQAAVWNAENKMSWNELSAKIGVKHLNGSTEPYFAAEHIKRGMQIIGEAERRAKEAKPADEPSQATAKQ
jgi:hypothetical protein